MNKRVPERAQPLHRRPVPQDEMSPWLGASQPPLIDQQAGRTEVPSRSVGFTISTTGYAISRRFHELLAPLGLHPRELGVLQAVASSEGETQQAIAERVGLPASRMVAIVDALQAHDLLERRQNSEDRRARALFLTSRGREVLGEAFAIGVEQEQRLTADLTDQEREHLLELLSRIGAHVGIPPDVHPGMGHAELADE